MRQWINIYLSDGDIMSEKLMNKYRPIVDSSGVFNLVSISSASRHPQQFIVTRGNLSSVYAGDTLNSKRKKSSLDRFRCSYPDCRQSLPEDTSQQVLFLRLTRNVTCSEAKSVLGKIADAVDETDGLVGFHFLHSNAFESVNELDNSSICHEVK
jgi:hypothetical protein